MAKTKKAGPPWVRLRGCRAPTRLAAADGAAFARDLHLERARVVRQVAVVDAEEQLPPGGHLHAVLVADHERRAIADAADQRPRRGTLDRSTGSHRVVGRAIRPDRRVP